MEFRILGPLEVSADGRVLPIRAGQQRALLALLLLYRNRVLSPDWIADRLWEDQLPESGTRALAFHVSRLRDALAPAGRRPGEGAGGLETTPGGYVLHIDPEAIDAVRFERLAQEGHRLLPDDPAAARELLTDALALWRGDALADVVGAGFAQPQIARLDELRLGALEDRLEAMLELGVHDAAVPELEALVAANPLREHLRGLLMLALYRSGRQGEALRVAGAGRRVLSEELGVDPSPELVLLETRILAQDPSLNSPAPAARARPRPRNPYKGLRPFGEADAADFFGRETVVGRLVQRLDEVARDGRLLAVVGPSGSGKSSVVRAGLIPVLRANRTPWQIAVMTPAASPFSELAGAISGLGGQVDAAAIAAAEATADFGPILSPITGAAGGTRLLLVIDQLEELFARVDETTCRRFLDGLRAALATPAGRLVVVATLRADFLQVPLAMPEIGELIRNGTELITPMSRAELERAIARPAEAVGVEVEPALVVAMATDVERCPGGMPLLQYTLTELFDRSDGRRLTREGYDALGGVAGTLQRRADEAWRALDGGGREIARQLLLGLVAVTAGRVATTRRAERAELETLAADRKLAAEVVDTLGRHGLLAFVDDPVTGAPAVQIAHEALLVHWPRLADWIEDLRDDLATRRRLADAAEDWATAGRESSFLAAGAKLARFEAWTRGSALRLTEGEQAFLDASLAERERLARLEAERAAREQRLLWRARLARRMLVGLLVVAIIGAAATAGAVVATLHGQQQTSLEQAAISRAQDLAAASVASRGTSRRLSLMLAIEGARATLDRGYVVEAAYDALQWALQDSQITFGAAAGEEPTTVRAAPDGARGVYLVRPEVLIRMAVDEVQRKGYRLTPSDCAVYLRLGTCPEIEAPAGDVPLGVRTAAGVVAAQSLASADLSSSRVRVLSELPTDISSLLTPFHQQTGVQVEWDPAANGDLAGQLKAGDLPDLAIVSRPSIATAAQAGWLMDLDQMMGTASLAGDATPYVLDLGMVAGGKAAATRSRYGLPLATSIEDLLWFPSAALAAAGHSVPRSPGDLRTLVAALQAEGRAPWCLGTEDGGHSGVRAAEWLSALVLAADPGEYDQWTAGKLAFNSSVVNGALGTFGALVSGTGGAGTSAIYRGWDSVNLIPARFAALGMSSSDQPTCWLYFGSSADAPLLAPRAAAVPFPSGSTGATMGRVYFVVVLHDRPEVRRTVEWLVGPQFASALERDLREAGLFPVRRSALPATGAWSDEESRLRAALDAGSFRSVAVDLFPEEVSIASGTDMCGFLTAHASPNSVAYGWVADGVEADPQIIWP